MCIKSKIYILNSHLEAEVMSHGTFTFSHLIPGILFPSLLQRCWLLLLMHICPWAYMPVFGIITGGGGGADSVLENLSWKINSASFE